MDVFLLYHVHEMSNGEESVKLIGVYASAEDAEAARLRILPQPGFRDLPQGFQVDEYTVGVDHWTEGYVTVTYEDLGRRARLTSTPRRAPIVVLERPKGKASRRDTEARRERRIFLCVSASLRLCVSASLREIAVPGL